MNELQWNFNQISYIFIQENAFEKVICKMAAILSQPRCVKLEETTGWKPAVMESVTCDQLLLSGWDLHK